MTGRRITHHFSLIAGLLLTVATGMRAQQSTPVPDGMANQPAPPVAAAPDIPLPPKLLSPVIWSEHPEIVQRFGVNRTAVRQMINSSLLKLTSSSDIAVAWARLGITPRDIVGIKITTMGGELLSSHRALLQAICDGLQATGVPAGHIIIWDKNATDMRTAGYVPAPLNGAQIGIASVFPGTGYDPNVVYKSDIQGTLIWGDSEFIHNGNDDLSDAANQAVKNRGYGGDNSTLDDSFGNPDASQSSNRSHYARLVTSICTKIINVPVLTDNAYIGINGCLGSLALGCVDNTRRFEGDPTYGDPAICEILSKDFMRRKVVVNILDALVAQYAGGPHFEPVFTRALGALYVSRDPVAIDSIVLRRMEQWRANDRQGRIDPIGKTASHVHSATAYNLGTDDPARIQLLRMP